MTIFVICTVRKVSQNYREKLENYVTNLESKGHIVHLPHRDTNQNQKGIDICKTNCKAIKRSDEIHIFYNPESSGTHFDMGMAFALGKSIKIIENVPYGEGKSFPRMLEEWQIESF